MSETEPAALAYAPLPLAELLAALRGQGLALGVREHLAVGRLLARFDDLDLETLRAALAAVLARNPGEAERVRETFDQLYTIPGEKLGPPPSPPPPRSRERLAQTWSRLWRMGRLRWVAWLAAAVLALALAGFAGSWTWHHFHPPEPRKFRDFPPAETPLPGRPPPPRITDTYSARNRNRAIAASAGAAALVFLWLYLVRTRRLARRRARFLWSQELDTRPGPQTYDLVIKNLPSSFAAEVLDDVATVLGRQSAGVPRGRDLDVDRTLDRTLRAGLAPHVVLRTRAASLPLLVLEDVEAGMRPWQRRVAALLTGLEARGVPLDHWRFNADAGRLFRSVGGPTLSLKQLSRLRAESPLLVISAGREVLEGDDLAVAPWVGMLRAWSHRAWLHPATDPGTWSVALRKVPLEVWPMTPAGLLAAARQVARGDVRLPGLKDARTSPQRPPTPLDVDRLRWLLTLAPRRDPGLGELLRQRFGPDVPEAALLEALAAPPLARSPGVGPMAAEVRQFLLEVLDDSRPVAGSAAHERWRLDRALQQVNLEPAEAAAELAELATGPLGGEVERALRPLPRETVRLLKPKVLRPLRRRATREGLLGEPAAGGSGRRWTWPTLGELAVALIAAAVIWGAAPWLGKVLNDQAPVRQKIAYNVEIADDPGGGRFLLRVKKRAGFPQDVSLYQDEQPYRLIGRDEVQDSMIDDLRGHWYYVRAPIDRKTLAVSLPQWVEPAKPAPPVVSHELMAQFLDADGRPVPGVYFRFNYNSPGTSDATGKGILGVGGSPGSVATLRAEAGGFRPIVQQVVVPAGPKELIRVVLTRNEPPPAQTGTLVVTFNPPVRAAGSVRVSSGSTSLTGNAGEKMALAAGTWRLTSPLLVGEHKVVIQAGKLNRQEFPIDAFGFVKFDYPEDVQPEDILVGGRLWNGGSLILQPARYTVELKGHGDQKGEQKTFDIVAGETTYVKLDRERQAGNVQSLPDVPTKTVPSYGTVDSTGNVRGAPVAPALKEEPPISAPSSGSETPAGNKPSVKETIVERQGNPVDVDFDCEDVRSVSAIYELRSDEEYVGAKLEVLEVANAKKQTLGVAVYDEKRRQVKGVATFLGLDKGPSKIPSLIKKLLKPCPGRGHARVRLLVTVRTETYLR